MALRTEPGRPTPAGADRPAGGPRAARRGRHAAGVAAAARDDGPRAGLPPLARLRHPRGPGRSPADVEPSRLLRQPVPGQYAVGGLLSLHGNLLPLAGPAGPGLDPGAEGFGRRDRRVRVPPRQRPATLAVAGGGLVLPPGRIPDDLAELSAERGGGLVAGRDVVGGRPGPPADRLRGAGPGGRGGLDAGLGPPGDVGACPVRHGPVRSLGLAEVRGGAALEPPRP